MKKLLLLLLAVQLLTSLQAQQKTTITHHGFYLSMAVGPAFGNVNGKTDDGQVVKVEGTAVGFDAQIGGTIGENLILHGTLQGKSIFAPTINGVKLTSKYTFDENFIGAGLTKYSKENFFGTVNLGAAYYSFTMQNSFFETAKSNTRAGFSFNVRAGKEWLVSPKWGLGAALFYSRTSLSSKDGTTGVNEKWNGNRFGIYFQATFNRTRQ
ncbi:MAG: hypothetical protein QM791_11125 [Ferruginibacter sp.]